MMYKFSKRRQKIWLNNLNKSMQTLNDTGSRRDYVRHMHMLLECKRKYPNVFRRLAYEIVGCGLRFGDGLLVWQDRKYYFTKEPIIGIAHPI